MQRGLNAVANIRTKKAPTKFVGASANESENSERFSENSEDSEEKSENSEEDSEDF